MDTCVIVGRRGRGLVLIHESNRFHKVRQSADKIYWKCAVCEVGVQTNVFPLAPNDGTGITVLNNVEHVHADETDEIQKSLINNRLREAARNDVSVPVRRSYNQALRALNQQGGGDIEPRSVPEYYRVRGMMNRARFERMPPLPSQVDDVVLNGEYILVRVHIFPIPLSPTLHSRTGQP